MPLSRRVARAWAAAAAAVAIAATAIDCFLLQQKYGLFAGGFLAVDPLDGAGARAMFVAASLLSDLSVTAPLAVLTMWSALRLGLRLPAAWLLSAAVAAAPLCVGSVVNFSLASYLGDALTLGLLFDLAGGSAAELLAVGRARLLTPALVVIVAAAAVTTAAWRLHRLDRPRRRRRAVRASLVMTAAIVALVSGVVTVTARHDSPRLDNGLRRKPSGQFLGWIAGVVSDRDGDGYGWLARPRDPDPDNAAVFPYALDMPGNGIDENGIGGDLPPGDAYVEEPPPAGGADVPRRRAVVLVVLEGFRADLIGSRYRGSEVTPILNRLAAQGVSSRFAYSHNGYTAQSRYHIFSGSIAGIRAGTLIDDFKAQGYEVAYFSGQDDSFGGPLLGSGLERADIAYDARADRERRYTRSTTPGSLAVPLTVVLARVEAYLAGRRSAAPVFLYVNFHDTHFPYSHPGLRPLLTPAALEESAITPERGPELRATYMNSAANVDRAVGTVLEAVRASIGREPAVIVTADHGESLFDDGLLGHGTALTDVQTRVPLIVSNLPVIIEEPFGHAALRDAIARALRRDPVAGDTPIVRQNPTAAVFQYLGRVERPAQIALTRIDGRTLFDFRTGLVRLPGDAWRHADTLDAEGRGALLALIHMWERMRVAASAAEGAHP